MSARRLSKRPLRFLIAGVLVAAGTLAVAAPAQAAATASLAWVDAGRTVLAIDASAAPATIYLGFDSSDNTVTFRLPGEGFATGPDDCYAEYPPGLPDQYVHCPAATLNDLTVAFGPGNDTLYMDGVCYGVITVAFGDGGNTMTGDSNCATVIKSTSGSGDDSIYFAGGGGTASLGAGNDESRGSGGGVVVTGGPGNDRITGTAGNDSLSGEDGNDSINGWLGNDVESGGNGDDEIGYGSDDDQGADDVSGGAGVDKVRFTEHTGGGMAISLDDVANDGTTGEGDNIHSDLEIVVGSPGDDTITGTAAPDNIDGHWGADTIRGGGGNDRIDGNSDNDVLFGQDGDDEIYGGSGNDQVTGDGGVDNLFGDYTSCCLSNGNDNIFAADGVADAINCGGGADTLAADQLDVVGGDGNQVCESVTRTTVAPPTTQPPVPPPPGASTALTFKAGVAGRPTRSKGVKVATTCSTTCVGAAGVAISKKLAKKYGLGKKTLIGLAKGGSATGGAFTVKVKIKAKARTKLAKAGTIPAIVVVVVANAAGVQQSRSIKIKLKP